MTLRKYIIIMSVMTAICWSAWLFVLYNVNPELTNWIGFTLFYTSLFLALVGAAALIGFTLRFIALKKKLAFRLVKDAFRQSFLFAILLIISLILLGEDLFSWLNLMFLVIGLSVFEFFWLSYEKR